MLIAAFQSLSNEKLQYGQLNIFELPKFSFCSLQLLQVLEVYASLTTITVQPNSSALLLSRSRKV